MVSNLENSIILGIILVVGVLLFFLGLRNAIFVGVAIPLSMLMSFLILNSMGITLNVMVLFSLVIALGMLVDNGIVIVENIYRYMDEGNTAYKGDSRCRRSGMAHNFFNSYNCCCLCPIGFVARDYRRIYEIFTHDINDCFGILSVCSIGNQSSSSGNLHESNAESTQ